MRCRGWPDVPDASDTSAWIDLAYERSLHQTRYYVMCFVWRISNSPSTAATSDRRVPLCHRNRPSRSASSRACRGARKRHVTGVSTEGVGQGGLSEFLSAMTPGRRKGQLTAVAASVAEERRAGSGSCTSPHGLDPYASTSATCGCRCAARSGEADWVVVRLPPGISSTLRGISVYRLNMSI